MIRSTTTKLLATGALALAGLGTAGMLAAGSANAADDTAASSTSSGTSSSTARATSTAPDPTESIRSDEHLLTSTTAAKVEAAALSKHPGATLQRVETDSDGVYEAHVVSGGKNLIVQVGKDFTVTGTQTRGPGGGHGDGDAPAAPAA